MSKQVTVFFHGNCPDGMGAAYAAWKVYGDKADYIGVQPCTPPLNYDPTGKTIFILDVCFKREVLEEWVSKAKSLLVIDHHKTSMEALKDFQHAIFDMNKSGAGLAWEYFDLGPKPWLIKHIQDADLWAWDMPKSKPFMAYLGTCMAGLKGTPHFPLFKEIEDFEYNATTYMNAIEQGTIILAELESIAQAHADAKAPIYFHGHNAHQVECTVWKIISRVGELIYESNNTLALIWNISNNTLNVSLRSKKDSGIDVGAIAKTYGGGGHASAAGFKLSLHTKAGMDFFNTFIGYA